MKYELLKHSGVGVIVDPTPIFGDIKDTFKVQFNLPEKAVYIALFRSESGVEYRKTVIEGIAEVPKELLGKEQLLGLTVCQVDGEKITETWECHSLRIGSFLSMRKTQWQITAGMDDRAMYARLACIEKSLVEALESSEEKILNLKESFEKRLNEIEYSLKETIKSFIETNQLLKSEDERLDKNARNEKKSILTYLYRHYSNDLRDSAKDFSLQDFSDAIGLDISDLTETEKIEIIKFANEENAL